MNPALRSVLLLGLWFVLALVSGLALSLAGTYLYLNPQIPEASSYRNVTLETPLRIYTADGKLMAEFGERRLVPIAIEEVPQAFKSALLDTEDKRFYEHSGIDYLSLANDTLALLWNRDIASGASTITMQLSRNISFSLEQTFIRKFKEMLLALKLERELTKDEILELYINAVPFGKRSYGAQAAAYTYYNRPLNELRLDQLAMLAGIPQAPSAGNPINGPKRAIRRRNLVLSRMLEQGSITPAQHAEATAQPISAQVYERQLEVPAAFASEWVRSLLLPRYPDLYTGGYEVHTTLLGAEQLAATQSLRDGLIAYDQQHGYRGAEASVLPENFDRALREARTYADLAPAIVTAVNAEGIEALLGTGATVSVAFSTMSWARPYLNVNQRGPVPSQPADIVAVGDLIRLQLRQAEPAAAAGTAEVAAAAGDSTSEAPAQTWHLTQLPEAQGALISLNARNGSVLAIEGGFDFALSQFNHALQASRQPGSGFKPFVYSAALERKVTPASIFMDAPLVFDDEELETEYRPDNDNSRYNGPTRLREALYRSINLVSMRVVLDIGAGSVLRHVANFGFPTSTFPRDTQLALGGGTMAVTPLQMAQAYGVIANGGYQVEPYIVDRVLNLNGDVLEATNPLVVCPDCEDAEALIASGENLDNGNPDSDNPDSDDLDRNNLDSDSAQSTEIAGTTDDIDALDTAAAEDDGSPAAEPPRRFAKAVIDPRNAFIMDTMLRDVIRRGTGRRALALDRPDLAGKTGTTNDGTDTWFNGYANGRVTTVWIGFSNYDPLGARAYGGNTALPVWINYMRTALDGLPIAEPVQPPGIAVVKIDPTTGEAARPGQDNAIFEYFFAETAPKAAPATELPTTPDDDSDFQAVDIF